MVKSPIFQGILNEIQKMPVIDTHEHLLWTEKYRVESDTDVLDEYLGHYLKSDLISAGLKPEEFAKVIDVQRDIEERWKIVEPYWEVCRYTGYGRALDIAVKAIYNIDGINARTIQELHQAFLQSKTLGHYQHVLRDLCGIRVSLLDVWTFRLDGENELFRRIWQPLDFIMPMEPYGPMITEHIEKHHGIKVRTLDDWKAACEQELDYILRTYQVEVLKCSIAYNRTLRFAKVDYATARDAFAVALSAWENSGRAQGLSLQLPVEVQDYMMHFILGVANQRNLTIQFHTGLLEGNGNVLSHSDPALMINLFNEYPNVNFDLFHISYPYQNVASALCKTFSNVFIDMCWAHIISPVASIQALDEFLDAVPYNKISAFGGDYMFVDGVYGHLQMARENVSHVLAKKVEEGIFPLEKALDIAHALFYDNPKRIFKLSGC